MRTNNAVQNMPKSNVALVVQCTPDRGASDDKHVDTPAEGGTLTAQSERKVIAGERPLFCTTSAQDEDIGVCFAKEADCQWAFDKARSEGKAVSQCATHAAVACFNYNVTLTGDRIAACAPSVRDCETQLAGFRGNPDYTVSAQQCGVYRARKPEPQPDEASDTHQAP